MDTRLWIHEMKRTLARLKNDLSPLALPALVVFVGAALRFYDLGAESYWGDEVHTLHVALGGTKSLLSEFVEGNNPPVYLALMALWVRLAGTTELATRFLSAWAGTAAIAALYAIGRHLFSRKVALVGAGLMALSEFQIWYAQDSRYYALLVFTSLISFYVFLIALERDRPSLWIGLWLSLIHI